MSFNQWGLIILLISACVVSVMYIKYYIVKREKKILSIVKAKSTRLYALNKAAEKNLIFLDVPKSLNVRYHYNSKRALDNANGHDALIYVATNYEILKELYMKLTQNRAHADDFRADVYSAMQMQTPSSVIENTKIKESKFEQIEEKLCKEFLASFRLDTSINLIMTYVTPKRHDEYERLYSTNYDGLRNAHNEKSRQKLKQVEAAMERAKMSPKLRYEVLTRDRFHCVICGRGKEDGVKLHVDHIIPVSKGGKTELSNLRVLCDSCNLGKRDSYNPNGIN